MLLLVTELCRNATTATAENNSVAENVANVFTKYNIIKKIRNVSIGHFSIFVTKLKMFGRTDR